MAANVGQKRRPFIEMYEELTTSIQLKLMDYVKSLLDPVVHVVGECPSWSQPAASQVNPIVDGSGQRSGGKSTKQRQIETEDGWPVMPEVNEKDLKDDLEDLLRQYLTAQYSESGPDRSSRVGN